MPDGSTLAVSVAVCALLAARSLRSSKETVQQRHLRGRALHASTEATETISRTRQAFDSPLLVGRQEFSSEIATRHFAFIGATGSGKTLLQRLLMQTALRAVGTGSGQRGLVYDAKQDIVSILCGMRLPCPIHILNPLDARAIAWNMAADIENPAAALQVATTLIPESKSDSNPFFSNAARHLVYGGILSLIHVAPGRWTFRHLLLLLRDPERLKEILGRSECTQHLLNYFSHETTAQNILATVLTYITPYEIIAACWDRAKTALSLSKWTESESVLVLGNDEQNRAALDTINRLLFHRLAELALGGQEVDSAASTRRTWFFLDEVREAGKLDLLGRLLTKGRSKGAAVSLGLQDISGMREAYGRELADELLGQCNTKVILRLNSPETASWAAKLCGKREVLESHHGRSRSRPFSFGGQESFGESISHSISQRPVVLESEIMGLPETSRESGLRAFFINPVTGPFEDHIESHWLSRNLLPANPSVPNFVPRPYAHQYLRPWCSDDDLVLNPACQFSELSFTSKATGRAT